MGCGAAAPATPEPRLAAATPGDSKLLTRRALLRYDIRGRPFPLPVVTGKIAGQDVLMLVDTGANSHVIAGWFARKLGLPMKKLGDVGTDHVGKSVASYRLDNVDIVVDDWGRLKTSTVLAMEVPAVIEKLGIGAFISPQHLDEEGDAVVLDLEKGELRSAWWDDTKKAMDAKGTALIDSSNVHTCEEGDGPVRGLAFVVPSTIESQNVRLLLDTGAQHSDLFASSSAGQKLTPESAANKEAMYTASGRIPAREIKGAHMTTGSYASTSDVELIQGAPDASCLRDGVLAMDVLRECSLLLGRSKVYGRCLNGK